MDGDRPTEASPDPEAGLRASGAETDHRMDRGDLAYYLILYEKLWIFIIGLLYANLIL